MSKIMGIFVKFWLFLRCLFTKYGCVTWPKMQISKIFYFVLILYLILGKVTKFLVEKLSTSEVSSQKPHGGGGWGNTPPSAFRVKAGFAQLRENLENSGNFLTIFTTSGKTQGILFCQLSLIK